MIWFQESRTLAKPWYTSPNWVGEFLDFTSDEDIVRLAGTAVASGTSAVFDVTTSFGSSGGLLRSANNSTDDDSGYNWTGDSLSVSLAKGTTTRFIARHRQSDATQSDAFIGLAVTDTSLIAGVANGIWFAKNDGDAYWDFNVYTGSASVIAATGVAVDVAATWIELAFEIVMDASTAQKGLVTAWVNGAKVYEQVVTGLPTAITGMALAYAWQSGEAAAKTADLDYIGWAQTRNTGVL